jgi:dihydrofolate reductase
MKASASNDLLVGGVQLAAHALDECHVLIHPILIGGGKPALPSDARTDLELLEDREFSKGVMYLRYRIPT